MKKYPEIELSDIKGLGFTNKYEKMSVVQDKLIEKKKYVRSIYCSFQVKNTPIVKHWSLWEEMKIKHLNYCLQDPQLRTYRVIVTSHISHTEKTWTTFMFSLHGFNKDSGVYNKSKSPFHKYTAYKDDLAKNCITMPAAVALVEQPLPSHFPDVLSFLKYPYTPTINLVDIAKHFLGPKWYKDETKKLAKHNFVLEAHRKFLVLEKQIMESKNEELMAHLQSRRSQALTRRYPVVDLVTLIIPALVALAEDDIRVMDKKARLTIAVEDLKDMVLVYNDLSAQLPELFVKDSISLPHHGTTLQASDMDKINYRKQKEQNVIKMFTQKHKSEWVDLYLKMIKRTTYLLQHDTYTASYTKHLQPTHSLNDAVYDLDSFLRQQDQVV